MIQKLTNTLYIEVKDEKEEFGVITIWEDLIFPISFRSGALYIENKQVKERRKMKTEFIHYGHIIDLKKFEEITDHPELWYLNKPKGGLWCSPVDSNWGWKDWCKAEDFCTGKLKTWTKFKLKPGTKILIIDSIDDLVEVVEKYNKTVPTLSGIEKVLCFKKIKEDGYRGIYLTEKGNDECHLPWNPYVPNLNTWDCECMILFDLNCIEIYESSN